MNIGIVLDENLLIHEEVPLGYTNDYGIWSLKVGLFLGEHKTMAVMPGIRGFKLSIVIPQALLPVIILLLCACGGTPRSEETSRSSSGVLKTICWSGGDEPQGETSER